MYKTYFKRAFDILTSSVLLVFFLPVCLVVAVSIKLDSSGPVFADVPERVGQKGRKFKMYKFRSMIQNAHLLLRTTAALKNCMRNIKRKLQT